MFGMRGIYRGRKIFACLPVTRTLGWSSNSFLFKFHDTSAALEKKIADDINLRRSKAGALRFLKNIILLPGCGQFVPSASFVLHYPGSDDLVGAILTSEVSPGVGHTTQVCVLPGHQGQGLGRALMLTAADALRGLKFQELTLTVTSENRTAVRLYEQLGFKTLKTFTAGVWPR